VTAPDIGRGARRRSGQLGFRWQRLNRAGQAEVDSDRRMQVDLDVYKTIAADSIVSSDSILTSRASRVAPKTAKLSGLEIQHRSATREIERH
jgi:hypothetical protein